MSDHPDELVNHVAVLQAEVEGLRGALLFEQQASAAYKEDADRLREQATTLDALLTGALAWVPERGIGGRFRAIVRQKRAASSADPQRKEG